MVAAAPVLPVGYVVSASRIADRRMILADEVGRPFHRDGWIYEEKYDGWRMAA